MSWLTYIYVPSMCFCRCVCDYGQELIVKKCSLEKQKKIHCCDITDFSNLQKKIP